MTDKKYKLYEDLIEEYRLLTDKDMEIPRLILKGNERLDTIIAGKGGTLNKCGDANDAYKTYIQINKLMIVKKNGPNISTMFRTTSKTF